MRTYALAALIALLHLTLALFYAHETPYRTAGILLGQRDPATGGPAHIQDIGAPDERAHANFVQHLLDGKGLPIFKVGDPNLYESYQSHQAPAYYLAESVFARLVGVKDVSQPEGARLRWLNALIGAGTVLGVFFLAFWGFERSDVALGAAAFAALLPMLCALDAAITNDSLLYCTLTWALALIARGVVRGWNWKLAIGVGLVTGLALETKTTALSLLPVLLVTPLLGKKATWKMALSALAIAVLIALPWWIRNENLYGDPFAISAFVNGFHTPRTDDMAAGIGAFTYWTDWFGWWTIRSFFGAFGYMDIFLNSSGLPRSRDDHETLYRLMLVCFLVLGAGWLFSLRQEGWKRFNAVHAMNGLFLLLVLAGFLKFNLLYFQAQGRYVIPAIGPIACGIAVGLCFLAKDKSKVAVAALAAVLLGINLYALNRLPEEFAKRVDGLAMAHPQRLPLLATSPGIAVVRPRSRIS